MCGCSRSERYESVDCELSVPIWYVYECAPRRTTKPKLTHALTQTWKVVFLDISSKICRLGIKFWKSPSVEHLIVIFEGWSFKVVLTTKCWCVITIGGGRLKKCFLEVSQFEQQIGISELFPEGSWIIGIFERSSSFVARSDGKLREWGHSCAPSHLVANFMPRKYDCQVLHRPWRIISEKKSPMQ